MFYLYRPNYFLSQLKPVPLMLECSDFYDRKQYALYERLQPGDVVWARMPFKAKKLKKIQESHHIRPYVVMAKENDEIIAYYCSTKAKQWISHYTVNAKRHDEMKKDSHVYLNQTWTLKINDLQSYYMTLENYEKLAINKMVKDTDLPSFKDVNPVTPGHIVQYENHKYLITDEIKHCYYGFEVVQQFNKKLYYVSEGNFCVSLEERIKLPVKNEYPIIKKINHSVCTEIYDKYLHTNRSIVSFDYKFGTMFRLKGDSTKYFYLYTFAGIKYCLSIWDLENGFFRIQKLPEENQLFELQIELSDGNVDYILSGMKTNYSQQYQWLMASM